MGKGSSRCIICLAAFCGALAAAPAAWSADPPPAVDVIMGYPPAHKADIEYDTVDPKVYPQCKVHPVTVKDGKKEVVRGWLLVGPDGQALRKFVDSDGDGDVDLFCFYKNGMEVYRDQKGAKKNRIEQSRWVNLGGTRWGVDTNSDGKIDVWKMISPDEVSRIAIKALVSQDVSLLTPLLVTKEDLQTLGIKGPLEAKLLANVADPAAKLRKIVSGSKMITPRTAWAYSSVPPPSVIPADVHKTTADLYLSEGVMAMLNSPDPQKPQMVNIGELVRIGDVWKMTMLPQPVEGNVEFGTIMYHSIGAGGEGLPSNSSPVSDEIVELLKKLKELMDHPPAATASKANFDKYHVSVESVLVDIINKSPGDEEKAQFFRQLLDWIAAAVQSGNYPGGVDRLEQLELQIAKSEPKSPLAAAAKYRWIQARYFMDMQDAKGDAELAKKAHAAWTQDVEKFLDAHPKAEDAPDAAMQLAVALEFAGNLDRAKKWLKKIAEDYQGTPAGKRAAGALNRMDLVGKSVALSGQALAGNAALDIKQLRGKTVLVVFWDTTTKAATDDLLALKALYDEYRAKGFEILGVNIDVAKEAAAPWLAKNQIKWPQIHEPGGLDGTLARDTFGIASPPLLILIDPAGKVTHVPASAAEVKTLLAELYEKK